MNKCFLSYTFYATFIPAKINSDNVSNFFLDFSFYKWIYQNNYVLIREERKEKKKIRIN